MYLNNAINQFTGPRQLNVMPRTLNGDIKELKHLCLFLRNPLVSDIRLEHILEYLNLMVDLGGWNHNTFIRKCSTLRKFFEYCRLNKLSGIEEMLIPLPRKHFNIPRVADERSLAVLLKQIPNRNHPRSHRDRALVHLAIDCGARAGELCSLNISDIDLNLQKAIIRTEKSRGRRPIREIFWRSQTNEYLHRWIGTLQGLEKRSEYFSGRDREALFISLYSNNMGQRLSVSGVSQVFSYYSRRAKLPRVNPHSVRHFFCHDIIKKGGSAADVMNLAGHATLASSTPYTAMFDEELKGRYRSLKGR